MKSYEFLKFYCVLDQFLRP